MSNEDMEDIKGRGNVYHRITEAMKFGFAEKTYLGDDQFTDVSEVQNDDLYVQLCTTKLFGFFEAYFFIFSK